MFNFPESHKTVLCYQGAANAVACDVISCKNANKVWFVVIHSGANDTDLTLQLTEATDVAAGTNSAVTVGCPIWRDNDAGTTSDVLVRATTDDDNIVIDPATENAVVAVIEWDPAKHTAGYDCVYLADSGGHASNTCTILAVIDSKVKGASLPAFITD
jgi:hypothetical protein